METRRRSIAKTVSWRILATLITFGIAYVFTSSIFESTILAIVLNAVKGILYYFHERTWILVKWGYRKGESEMVSNPKNKCAKNFKNDRR